MNAESEEIQVFTVAEEHVGTRLDVFLSANAGLSRSFIKNSIESGRVCVNAKPVVKAGYAVAKGDCVALSVPPVRVLDLTPCDLPVTIVYEDEDLAVIDKQQGLVVHPAPGSPDRTLVNALMYRLASLSSINGVMRPGIVHRLDKDTSGLLVVAKNDFSHVELQRQIAQKEAKRFYKALVDGVIKQDEGKIETLLDRSSKDRKKYTVVRSGGREAITLYRVLRRYRNYTLAEYELKTGRTHQIRVHSKFIGHPVVGDPVYGGSNKFGVNGQLLHAYKLVITHPRTKRQMEFEAPLPDYFLAVLAQIEGQKLP